MYYLLKLSDAEPILRRHGKAARYNGNDGDTGTLDDDGDRTVSDSIVITGDAPEDFQGATKDLSANGTGEDVVLTRRKLRRIAGRARRALNNGKLVLLNETVGRAMYDERILIPKPNDGQE